MTSGIVYPKMNSRNYLMFGYFYLGNDPEPLSTQNTIESITKPLSRVEISNEFMNFPSRKVGVIYLNKNKNSKPGHFISDLEDIMSTPIYTQDRYVLRLIISVI